MTAFVSALDLFSIGIGPSSSHTVGPMRAALDFAGRLGPGTLESVDRISCVLFGSLGATGIGHGTPDAIVAGLAGLRPEDCDPAAVRGAWSTLPRAADGAGTVLLGGSRPVPITRDDITFAPFTRLPGHPNAMTLHAWARDAAGTERELLHETYYSVGGGFIRRASEDAGGAASLAGGPRASATAAPGPRRATAAATPRHPLPYSSSAELLALCEEQGVGLCDIARANEEALHGREALDAGLDAIWAAMHSCVENGLVTPGVLPGGLGVKRRAPIVREQLDAHDCQPVRERDTSTEWLHAFALAVNEENASGGRVVTAPTNGAAGIIPAVAHYYLRFVPGASPEGIRNFLLTAAAIGSLVKANASISGAEGGCQAEVGSACAMAAGALCGVLGGTPRQVENAAEIAMEHHLGLTCDPVGGLVQVPCIERNAIAASTAVSAARLALLGDGTHLVSLDTVIETMRQTGLDMMTKYKETSEGGLAVNVIEC
ncbi:L-serine ammonia-lyase [Microterricola pindariensis]|uniref:L-serine ammonia-lyase n=1 Tax=Microterricola pindariensis TaxID=478010 RepID=A0ABX5AV51_9MICO|nr:L-serine ammonia-lyase [Microterricola pindariensis]PPL18825.1 L-serine ammonia-lyase [Microterricola pindariensis]